MNSDSHEEKFCTICFDTIENVHWIMENGEKNDAQFCTECTGILIETRLDIFMDDFIKETCLATISRVCKSPFPEYLSVDGTGYGEIVKYVCIDNHTLEPKFVSTKSNEYVQNFKNAINSLKTIVIDLDRVKEELKCDETNEELKDQVENLEAILTMEKAAIFSNF